MVISVSLGYCGISAVFRIDFILAISQERWYYRKEIIMLEWEVPVMERANRLEDFVKVFKPYPLTEDNFDSFYVDTSSVRVSNELNRLLYACKFDKESYDKFLFSGHMGSGKSTEMYRLREILKDEFEVIHVPLTRDLDILSISYIDLIFEIMSVIIQKLDSDKDYVKNLTALDELYKYWKSEHFTEELSKIDNESQFELQSNLEAEGSATIPSLLSKLKFVAKISTVGKDIFKNSSETKEALKTKIEPRIGELISALNDILLQISDNPDIKPLLLIIEDLDKADIADVEKIFIQHRQKFIDLKIKCIFMIPMYLEYSAAFKGVKESFTGDFILSTIGLVDRKGNPVNKNIQFYHQFVEKRADIDLIDEDALDFVIEKSGGILRDLFHMLYGAALEAKVNGRDRIILNDVRIEYQKLRDGYVTCISSREEVERIKEVYSNSTQTHTDDVMMNLFRANILIECQDIEGKYCVVHPTVIDYYKMIGEIDE